MISFDAKIVEPFLDRDANRAAAAPQTDEKIGFEAGFVNIGRQLK